MDPDSALRDLLWHIDMAKAASERLDEAVEAGNDEGGGHEDEEAQAREAEVDALRRAAESFTHLSEWLTNGGFLPEPWRPLVRGDNIPPRQSFVEVIVDRNPDAATEVVVFVDGVQDPNNVAVTNIDPGAGYTIDDWEEQRDFAAAGASAPNVRDFITASFNLYNDSEFIQ